MSIFKRNNKNQISEPVFQKAGKAFVVGIAGGTQSGKTTLAKELENALEDIKVKVFHMDDYYKPKKQIPLAKGPITKKEYTDFNQPDALYFPQLRLDIRQAIDENNADAIIVEGTMMLHDEEILSMLDLKLFVETRVDERAIRYVETYSKHCGHDAAKNTYLDLTRYRIDEYVEPSKWRADMILNGSLKSNQAIEIIKTYLLSKIMR